jgi:hypothetical protein
MCQECAGQAGIEAEKMSYFTRADLLGAAGGALIEATTSGLSLPGPVL